MSKHKSEVFLFVVFVINSVFVSLSFLLVPIESDKFIGEISLMSFIAGIIFWVSLITVLVSLIILSVKRRSFYKKYSLKLDEKYKRIGLLCCFKNKYAAVADILLIVSFVLLITALTVTGGKYYDSYLSIAFFVFSLFMHGIFNGKLFFYICALCKTIKNNEKKLKKGKVLCK